MTYIERLGPIFDLMGVRLQDLNAGCPRCGKRVSEVIDDTTGQWNIGQVVCVDCGTAAPAYHASVTVHEVAVMPSKQAPGKVLAVCRCGRMSMITSRENAQLWADKHLEQAA